MEAELECLTERRDVEAYYDNLCMYFLKYIYILKI